MINIINTCCCCCLVAQSCLTLCNPMDCSPPCFSVHGISQARILEWVPFPSLGDLPNPGIECVFPALAGGFFTFEPPGKPKVVIKAGGSQLRCPGDCVLFHCSHV